jgi:SAM-dependent methyltransferase
MLARRLAEVATSVCAIDLDEPSIELARTHNHRTPNVELILGDLLTYPFKEESFDFITSVATLHHMNARRGLERMRALLSPGGVLVVIGLARPSYPADLPREALAAVANRLILIDKTYWEHSSPTLWPPPETYRDMRAIAQEVLPGVRYRRRLLWRYSLVWAKPAA